MLLAVYLVVLALVAFWPTPVDRDAHDVLSRVIRYLNDRGIGWLTYARVEAAANVALFVPFGILGTTILRRWWVAAILGVAIAVGIEVIQGLLLPERFSTPADVVANGLGATVGALCVVAVRRVRRQRPR